MRACEAQPDLIGVEDEDAVIAERDFFGLPVGFGAVVGGPTGVTAPGCSDKVVVVSRNPLFDGLPGWLDERNRGTDTLYGFDTAGVISDFLCSQVWQSLRYGEHQNQG